MGTTWNLDAFNQNLLVLEAAKLAANVLKKGGVFVTKIFRYVFFMVYYLLIIDLRIIIH